MAGSGWLWGARTPPADRPGLGEVAGLAGSAEGGGLPKTALGAGIPPVRETGKEHLFRVTRMTHSSQLLSKTLVKPSWGWDDGMISSLVSAVGAFDYLSSPNKCF